MFEKLLRMYLAYMQQDVRSPVPHMIGPPGVGKSTAVEQLADVLGVRLHIMNVSRISPLELEGVQMPHTSGEEMRLKLLHAPFWMGLEEGDIVHLEEFLRGFPEVYNGLLDILTSREVAGYKLPRVFFVASSNTHVTYDPALEDRLLHLPVADPRKSAIAYKDLQKLATAQLGLMPDMAKSMEMGNLLDQVVCPAYAVLDSLTDEGGALVDSTTRTKSLRNLIGQVQLRTIVTKQLRDLLRSNNAKALQFSKMEHIILLADSEPALMFEAYVDPGPQENPVLENNRLVNLQLIELVKAKQKLGQEDVPQKEEEEDLFD